MDRVYIAGPITDNPNYKAEFSLREKTLKDFGYIVDNPVKEGERLKKKLGREPSWNEYMEFLLPILANCTAISLLPGWEKSKGARIEYDFAVQHNIKILRIKVLNRKWGKD